VGYLTSEDMSTGPSAKGKTAGPEKVKYYLLQMEAPVKGKNMKHVTNYIKTKTLENVGVQSFQKWKMLELWSFLEIENIGKSRVSRKQINN